jgi:HSP20 family protein
MSTAVAKREPRLVRPLFRRNPLATLRDEMQDLVSQVFGEETEWPLGRLSPNLDVSETDQAIEVRLELPGIDPKDVDIQVSGNLLTVSGQRREEREEKGKTWHRTEIRTGSFSRTVTLPNAVKEDAAEARYRDGVLTITLPKTEEAKAHKIKVKT